MSFPCFSSVGVTSDHRVTYYRYDTSSEKNVWIKQIEDGSPVSVEQALANSTSNPCSSEGWHIERAFVALLSFTDFYVIIHILSPSMKDLRQHSSWVKLTLNQFSHPSLILPGPTSVEKFPQCVQLSWTPAVQIFR